MTRLLEESIARCVSPEGDGRKLATRTIGSQASRSSGGGRYRSASIFRMTFLSSLPTLVLGSDSTKWTSSRAGNCHFLKVLLEHVDDVLRLDRDAAQDRA